MANTFPNDGRAGVGTNSPTKGQMEIQTTGPNANGGFGLAWTVMGENALVGTSATVYLSSDGTDDYDLLLTRDAQNANGLKIDKQGNATAQKNLNVTGNLNLTGNLNIKNWEIAVADYVFDAEYPLMPLTELEDYVTANRHLPEVPSEQEIRTHGLNLDGLAMTLLKKVEELTLHLIAHQKRIEVLESRLATAAHKQTRS